MKNKRNGLKCKWRKWVEIERDGEEMDLGGMEDSRRERSGLR